MSNVTFQLPDSLFRSIQELVEHEGYSIDQFMASAAAEKLAACARWITCAARPPAAVARILSDFWPRCPTGNRSIAIACRSDLLQWSCASFRHQAPLPIRRVDCNQSRIVPVCLFRIFPVAFSCFGFRISDLPPGCCRLGD